MGSKRPRQDIDSEGPDVDNAEPKLKRRSGFTVGPSNLPDGTYRRKVQKIKQNLIAKAKTKSAYAKIRAQTHQGDRHPEDAEEPQAGSPETTNLTLHPDREAMLNAKQSTVEDQMSSNKDGQKPVDRFQGRRRKNRPFAFAKEARLAEEKEAERVAKIKARERREQDRRAMAKAKRPDRNGNVRLGRQSKVLLRQVERLVT